MVVVAASSPRGSAAMRVVNNGIVSARTEQHGQSLQNQLVSHTICFYSEISAMYCPETIPIVLQALQFFDAPLRILEFSRR